MDSSGLSNEVVLPLLISFDTKLFRVPLRVTRSAMSALASVVSLGSPGSTTWASVVVGAEAESGFPRRRLLGGCPAVAALATRADSGAVVSPSSAEASRDSGWATCPCWMFMAPAVLLRFLFPALCDTELGDDMVDW